MLWSLCNVCRVERLAVRATVNCAVLRSISAKVSFFTTVKPRCFFLAFCSSFQWKHRVVVSSYIYTTVRVCTSQLECVARTLSWLSQLTWNKVGLCYVCWWRCPGSVPGAGHLLRYVTNHPRPTQPSIPSGSVNEYQLRPGRQRQVWFIPLADERGVCR